MITIDKEKILLIKACFKQGAYLKSMFSYKVGVIGLASFVTCTNIAHGHPIECRNEAAPAIFLQASGIVCLQGIKVQNEVGTHYYKASLQWLGAEKPNQFKLASVDADVAQEGNRLSFSVETGGLTLPQVDIPEMYGTNRYSANLVLKQENGKDLFELITAETYINPDYVEGQSWKPYALLSLAERQAVNLIGRSLPYAQLAEASYSFENVRVGVWELLEQRSEDSGMQVSVYRHEETDKWVMAFRGTEVCEFPCSFKEAKESILDVSADALLSAGTNGPQFRHAFKFTEDFLSRYPDASITVTGHSLGGGLAQAMGTTFGFETFAFNSAPVPKGFLEEHPSHFSEEELKVFIHVISDIYDPISHADETGETYVNASHITPIIQFDFKAKKVTPVLNLDRLEELFLLRFDNHSMAGLVDDLSDMLMIYSDGW